MNSMKAAIDAAPLHLAPFPHFIADGVLDSDMLRDIRDNWPSDRFLLPEGDGSLNRSWAHLIAGDTDASEPLGPFWRSFTAEVAPVLLRSVFERFAPTIPSDEFHVGQLVCFEAGPYFRIHDHHNHYNVGPDWIFTFLLYIDDEGREDRGTRLFSIDGFDPADDRKYFDAVSCSTDRLTFSPAVDSGFAPGRLLAFRDSPVSYHGSTPFKTSGRARSRKILRAHVQLPPEVGREMYGKDFLRRCTAYREDRRAGFAGLPGFARDREMVESGFTRSPPVRRTWMSRFLRAKPRSSDTHAEPPAA